MKIAMIGWEFPPMITGGLGVHCFELTKALAEKEVKIDFFMPEAETVSCNWMNIVQVGLKMHPLRFLVGPYASGFVKVGEQLIKQPTNFFEAINFFNEAVFHEASERIQRGTRYDLIHCHDWITVQAGVQLKKAFGLPLLLTIHSTEFDRTAGNPFPWILKKERAGVREAIAVITVSQRMRKQLIEKLGCSEEKIHVIYNAVDATKFDLVVKKSDSMRRKKIVLYHGRLTIQKGVDYFLKAAKKVLESEPDALFIVSGEGEMMQQLIDLSIDLGIQNKVFFLGRISDEELPFVYAISDVFVLPSVSEPFGITVLEAMAAGKPVIVSKTAGITEVVENVFKTDFWDVEKIAHQIVFFLKQETVRKSFSKAVKEEAKRFSWSGVAQETMKVYENILQKGVKA